VNKTLFHRRRVERFAQLLEEANGRRRHGRSPTDDELLRYVDLGQRIRDTEHPRAATPAEDFRTSLRAMLVATAQREGIGRTAGTAGPALGRAGVGGVDEVRPADGGSQPVRVGLRSRRTRGAIIVGLTAGTLALSGMSVASGDAVPGDALYGAKRATEGARLALTTSDMIRGQLYLEFAGTRASEARAEHGSAAARAGLLSAMDSQTIQGVRLLTSWALERHDRAALDYLDAWVPSQRSRLAPLDAGAGAWRVERSLALLSEIQSWSATVRSNLACGAGTGAADRLGPVPVDCPPSVGSGSGSGSTGGSSGGQGRSGASADPTAPAGGPSVAPSPAANPQSSPSEIPANPQPQPSHDHRPG
jgi:hypothetical protein